MFLQFTILSLIWFFALKISKFVSVVPTWNFENKRSSLRSQNVTFSVKKSQKFLWEFCSLGMKMANFWCNYSRQMTGHLMCNTQRREVLSPRCCSNKRFFTNVTKVYVINSSSQQLLSLRTILLFADVFCSTDKGVNVQAAAVLKQKKTWFKSDQATI